MSVFVYLRCDECGVQTAFRPWSKLTKMDVLRLQGGASGWYVDGGSVLCPAHRPDPMPAPQMETWGEYERNNAKADLEHEEWKRRECERIGVPYA